MTVETDPRPFASPSVLIVPVDTVHGFDYGMDSDGWVLTVAELACSIACRSCVWSEPRILSPAVDAEETSAYSQRPAAVGRELDRRMHHDPCYYGMDRSKKCCLVAALAKIRAERPVENEE